MTTTTAQDQRSPARIDPEPRSRHAEGDGMPPSRRPQPRHARIGTFTPTVAKLAVDAVLAIHRNAVPTADQHAGLAALLHFARYGDFVTPCDLPVDLPMVDVPSDLISTARAAEIARTSDRAVRLRIAAGHLADFGTDRAHLVSEADVRAWAAQRRQRRKAA